MQGQRNHERPFYRCRYPPNTDWRTRPNTRATSTWPSVTSSNPSTAGSPPASPRTDDTIDALYAAQPDLDFDPAATAAEKVIAECDRALERHRAALEAGADVQLVTGWITETQA